ncbi:TolC family protein [Undibacterium sp. Ji49W]|uniref:TolC family protein n=1 Tax=Undibacterium sp. Ji49W TaxID=3413040 RepID=UPI003BF35959
MDQARSSYPLMSAQCSALDAAREPIKKMRSEHLPSLYLVANYGSNYSSRSLSTPSDYRRRVNQRQIGLELTVPVRIETQGHHWRIKLGRFKCLLFNVAIIKTIFRMCFCSCRLALTAYRMNITDQLFPIANEVFLSYSHA